MAVDSPSMTLPNGNFSAGLQNWKILKHGDNPGQAAAAVDSSAEGDAPLCWHNASFGPPSNASESPGSAMCRFTGATAAAPHSLTLGIQSDPFPV